MKNIKGVHEQTNKPTEYQNKANLETVIKKLKNCKGFAFAVIEEDGRSSYNASLHDCGGYEESQLIRSLSLLTECFWQNLDELSKTRANSLKEEVKKNG